jgi:hypothetical protein
LKGKNTYSVVDLNEGVVDSDDLDTTVGDAERRVRMLFGPDSCPTETVDKHGE